MPVGIYLSGVDDYADFAQDMEGDAFDIEDAFAEGSDSEATTLNQAPHTPHTPYTSYIPDTPQTAHTTPLAYSVASTPAPEQTAVEAEYEDDSDLSDVDGPSPSDDESATSSAHQAPYPGVSTSASSYHPALAHFPIGPLDPSHHVGVTVDIVNPQHPEDPFDPGHFDPEGVTPGILASRNPSLYRFLELWTTSAHERDPRKFPRPFYPSVMSLVRSEPRTVSYDDLGGSWNDFQGINWKDLQISRKLARKYRFAAYKNFVNIPRSDECCTGPETPLAEFYASQYMGFSSRNHHSQCVGLERPVPSTESYYRFHSMHLQKRSVRLSHFQLRHILASSTRNRSFYPEAGGIRQINPISGRSETIVDLRNMENGGIVSTLAATERLLVGGTFNGEYCVKNLESSEPGHHAGQITDHPSGITTHIQLYPSRLSGAATAAIASNDRVFRTLDLATQKFVLQAAYNFPVNCSALSPDKRLRVMVGDHRDAVIANAETGEILQELGGHRDFGFACDWADDGRTVATGFQDMTVKIWDARRWCNSRGESTPVATLRSEMAGVRNLKFSPVGSGKRVLVAAEETDYINVIDARGFDRKQRFDIFGEIGGVDFCDGGRELQVLCCDWLRGGLMRLERCDWGREAGENGHGNARGYRGRGLPGAGFDWGEVESVSRRRKRMARGAHLEPF